MVERAELMRMTQHQTTRITGHPGILLRKSPILIASGVLLLTLAISGCSAVNMTGFSFPVFGLNSDASEKSDALMTSSIPEESQSSGATSQRLNFQ